MKCKRGVWRCDLLMNDLSQTALSSPVFRIFGFFYISTLKFRKTTRQIFSKCINYLELGLGLGLVLVSGLGLRMYMKIHLGFGLLCLHGEIVYFTFFPSLIVILFIAKFSRRQCPPPLLISDRDLFI